MKYKILLTVTLFAAILRFYSISSNPPGLYVDEVSLGYNAYSILKTGRDEYGKLFPIYLRSFDDYKPAVYAYVLVPSVAIFGLNEFAVRFPSALFGTLSIPILYFLASSVLKKPRTALLSSFLIATSPWHLQFSRAGFEANLMLFFILSGFTLLVLSPKNIKTNLIAAVLLGLAFNSYHSARIIIPALLAVSFVFWHKEIILQRKKLIIPTIVFLLFAIPSVVNYQQSLARAREVTIFSSKEPISGLISNYLSHFSPSYLFLSGDSIGRHSVPGIGQLLAFQLPFVLVGIVYLISSKSKLHQLTVIWLAISIIPAAIATPTPHALRSIAAIPVFSMATAIGINKFLLAKKFFLKISLMLVLVLVFTHNFFTYLHLYHRHYPLEKSVDWSIGVKDMVLYTNSIKKDSQKVFVTKDYSIPYIYFLFYGKYDPKTYQQEGGSSEHFGNYYFYRGVWNFPDRENFIVVSDPGGHPENLTKEIFVNTDDLIYRIGVQ